MCHGDWKGNAITVGDELVIMTYKELFGGQDMVLMIKDKDGKMQELVKPTKTHNGVQWEVHRKITVIEFGNTISNDQVPINLLDPFASPNTMNQCLCIKGISDDREQFMEHHLNQ